MSDAARTRFTREGLEREGFIGFIDMRAPDLHDLPAAPGVYVLLTPGKHRFLETSPAGWFKQRDPTVSIERLEAEWVDDATVVYIGKATSLRARVRQYVRHGQGAPVGHRGGRLVWQAELDELLLAWCPAADPRAKERSLIADFVAAYGRRPFANLTG